MDFSFTGFIYQVLIDPILSRLHESILINIELTDRVIDIASGTGSLSLAIAEKAHSVTGIDLSSEMIGTARRSAGRRRAGNVNFLMRDAADLSDFKDKEFDVAVTSMSVHQFDADLAIRILAEMKRIARKVILIDYNWPLPEGFSGRVASLIERFAGGDHYQNFKIYMSKEGLHSFLAKSGIIIKNELIRGNGVFLIAVGE